MSNIDVCDSRMSVSFSEELRRVEGKQATMRAEQMSIDPCGDSNSGCKLSCRRKAKKMGGTVREGVPLWKLAQAPLSDSR